MSFLATNVTAVCIALLILNFRLIKKTLKIPVGPSVGIGDRWLGGGGSLTTLEKFAKINNNRAEKRPKVGQNFHK